MASDKLKTYKLRGLETVFKRIVLPISDGVNKSRWWSVTASGHGYGNGSFESVRVTLLTDFAQPCDVVWDIGAHRGYVALALARKVGSSGHVIALEPSALNFWYLDWHIRINKFKNIIPIRSAVSDYHGESQLGGESSLSYTLEGGSEEVPVTTIAALIETQHLPAPSFIKIDTEGAELAILQGAGRYLNIPGLLLFIGTHSLNLHYDCMNFLQGMGFTTIQPSKLDGAASQVWEESEQEFIAYGPARKVPQYLIDRFRAM